MRLYAIVVGCALTGLLIAARELVADIWLRAALAGCAGATFAAVLLMVRSFSRDRRSR